MAKVSEHAHVSSLQSQMTDMTPFPQFASMVYYVANEKLDVFTKRFGITPPDSGAALNCND